MGGLSKRAYQLEEIRNLHAVPYLTLDAGNLLFKQENFQPAMLEQAKITAEAIIESYNLMKYDAVAVGKHDLAAGLSFLEKQVAHSKFQWLSANLVRKSTGKPVFQASMIRQAGNIRIGIIGITGDDANILLRPDKDAILLPWKDILPDIASKLASQCDLLILLSNNPSRINQEIADSLADINLIIQATPRSDNSAPQLVNNSIITQTGKQGKYFGWVAINWQDSKTWAHPGAAKELATTKQELDGINGRISRIERKTAKENLITDSRYQKLIAAREEILSRIVFLENEQVVDLTQSPSTFENYFISLAADLPDQPDVQAIVETAKLKVNETGRSKASSRTMNSSAAAGNMETLPFIGWEPCATCHAPQTDFWRNTAHFSAYKTLVLGNQQYNLDCLPCHVTAEFGTTKIDGNDSALLSLQPGLQLVGCEVCHGPGRRHAANADPAFISRKPMASICLRCHTNERDPSFNYDNDVKQIACPAGK